MTYDDGYDSQPPFIPIHSADQPPMIGPRHVPEAPILVLIKFADRGAGWGAGRISLALHNDGYDVSAETVQNVLDNRGILLDDLP